MPPDSVFVTPKDFAERVGVSDRQVRADLAEGLPHVRLPVLIPLERALRWREDNRRPRRASFNAFAAHEG